MQIDWWTLALQAINFIVLVWLLHRFLYGPVKDVITRRRALSEEALAKATAKEAEAEAVRLRLEDERAALAQERRQMLKEVQDQTTEAREKAAEKSRDDARQMLEEARTSIAKEREEALAGMKEEVARLAMDLAAGILKKSDAAALANACFNQLDTQLRGLSDADRAELRDDAAVGNAGIAVVTAEPLAADDRDKWKTMISAHLGEACDIRFETDPALIGGAELRFPHTALKFSWADRLERARRVLQSDDTAS